MSLKESFAQFLEDPSREKLRELFQLQTGEEDFLDFKLIWLTGAKLAKHILAFSNSGGGCLVVGVGQSKDGTFKAEGLEEFWDKVEIKNSVNKFLPSGLNYTIHDFHYESSEYAKILGKKF